MQIATNSSSIALGNQLESNSLHLSDRLSSLSSGKRLQSAADDSANLKISNRLNKLGNGMQVAIRNANDGISTLQTAEGALQEATNILQRMRNLSIQAANATNRDDDIRSLDQEYTSLKQELNRIAENTTFGGQRLLDGSLGVQSFQVGAEANEIIQANFKSILSKDLSLSELPLQGQAMGGLYQGSDLATARTNLLNNGFGNGGSGPAIEQLNIDGITPGTTRLNSNDSAQAMAEKINAMFNQTGIDAEAINTVSLHVHNGAATNRTQFDAGEQVSFVLGNGDTSVTISMTASGEYDVDMVKLREKINENASLTNISADFDNSSQQLILKSELGVNIEISDFQEGDSATDNQLQLQSLDDSQNVINSTSLNNDGSAIILRGRLELSSLNGEAFSVTSNLDFGALNNLAGSGGTETQARVFNFDDTSLMDYESAQKAISVLDSSLAMIDRSRATFGAVMNRLTSTVNNLSNVYENSENARGQIVDADYSKEAAELAKLQVTQQASTALLSQANSIGEQAIRLLG